MSYMNYRYPGARPFETSQRNVFFGREKDIDGLATLIDLEPLVVLYGKSGTGKSSLLNAGIIPLMSENNQWQPLRVRFNVFQEGTDQLMPVANMRAFIRGMNEETTNTYDVTNGFLAELLPDDFSLWREVRQHFIWSRGEQRLLLLFDQFEELFTYPAQMVMGFRQQLAESLYTTLPQRYWDALAARRVQGLPELNDDQHHLLQQPTGLRVVFAVRSDRLHLLHQLNDFLPNILRHCYELGALDSEQARQAIMLPAKADGEYASTPFNYTEPALQKILYFLTEDGSEKIESTQLQIICNGIEETVISRGMPLIDANDIEEPGDMIARYYDRVLEKIADPSERLRARRLIEEGLIYEEEERRLSLYEGQIYRTYSLEANTLQLLTDSHLLRAEPSLQGGYTYELSHDTLVRPVLNAKDERLDADRRRAEEEARSEHERELAGERKKSRRAIILAIIGFFLAATAIGAFIVARQQIKISDGLRIQAENEQNKAESALKQFQVAEAEKVMTNVNKSLELVKRYKIDRPDLSVKFMEEAKQELAKYPNNPILKEELNKLDK